MEKLAERKRGRLTKKKTNRAILSRTVMTGERRGEKKKRGEGAKKKEKTTLEDKFEGNQFIPLGQTGVLVFFCCCNVWLGPSVSDCSSLTVQECIADKC